MKEEDFLDIMHDDDLAEGALKGFHNDNALAGLLIVNKYLSHEGICGADHDIIYSVSVTDIVEAGITIRDTKQLVYLNWMVIDDEYLACFV